MLKRAQPRFHLDKSMNSHGMRSEVLKHDVDLMVTLHTKCHQLYED